MLMRSSLQGRALHFCWGERRSNLNSHELVRICSWYFRAVRDKVAEAEPRAHLDSIPDDWRSQNEDPSTKMRVHPQQRMLRRSAPCTRGQCRTDNQRNHRDGALKVGDDACALSLKPVRREDKVRLFTTAHRLGVQGDWNH
jgi:hypothetical protein